MNHKRQMENFSYFSRVLFFISHFLLISVPSYSQPILNNFFQCLSHDFPSSSSISSNVLYVPTNSSYSSLLDSTIQNRRFLTSTTPKPLAIVEASTYDQIRATVNCCRQNGVQIRTRSGGHDYEGLSYTSRVPFIMLDLQNLNAVNVSLKDNSAWVQSGATLGELYYWIVQKSPGHGFSAGTCPTVGAGGHFSGGGFGTIARKYGLAADNVLDAVIIDVNGRILDRKSMGEDLFWAIRGGGGASFGVIVSWKIRLLEVPPVVTVFRVSRTVGQGATDLAYKWQKIGNKISRDLFMRLIIGTNGEGQSRTIQITFETLYQGRIDQLLAIMNQSFPELGLKKEDCTEMSWIQSVLFIANRNINNIDELKNRVPDPLRFSKATSDYVKQPLSKVALENLWKWCLEEESPILIFEPYGGIMEEIPAGNLPFPHRKGILYNIQYIVQWDDVAKSDIHINWIRRLYGHMTPYVSKAPRSAYLNYRDLDFGVNKIDGATYAEAEAWGSKYFDQNFRRLAIVKGKVDPQNFFRNEQSIPPI